jgi:FkbM family methyltransferase
MGIKHLVKRALLKTGYDLSRFGADSHPLARRKKFLEIYGVNLVLDVGANSGQFAQEIRGDLGYAGKIVSFEPIRSVFKTLQKNAAKDPKWDVMNCALGEADVSQEINIAGNTYSSSLLGMLPSHRDVAPESDYVAKETIVVKTLDSILDSVAPPDSEVYLKIDTQGYEEQVLKGAERSLGRIRTIQLEMSLLPLYEGGALFGDLHALLEKKGYSLISLEPGFSDRATGRLLQVDGIYRRF